MEVTQPNSALGPTPLVESLGFSIIACLKLALLLLMRASERQLEQHHLHRTEARSLWSGFSSCETNFVLDRNYVIDD